MPDSNVFSLVMVLACKICAIVCRCFETVVMLGDLSSGEVIWTVPNLITAVWYLWIYVYTHVIKNLLKV